MKKVFEIWPILLPKRRKQVFLILLLTLLVSIVEVVSIGAVLPFLSVLINPEDSLNHPTVKPFLEGLESFSHSELLFYITCIFIAALITSGLMRVLHLWVTARISNAIGSDLSYKVYQAFLRMPYGDISKSNSSEVINAVLTKVDRVVLQIIFPVLNLISSSIMIIFILTLLVLLDPVASLAALSIIGIIYVTISLLSKKRLLDNSEYIAYSSNQIVQLIQESRGSIKDIILGNMYSRFYLKFRNLDWAYRYKQGVNLFINQSPRFAVETIGASVIVLISYIFAISSEEPQLILPSIGVLVFGMQRLLPLVQIVYRSWSLIQGGMASFSDVLVLTKQERTMFTELEKCDIDIAFKKHLTLENVSFKYNRDSEYILKHINLKISKGSRIGIIGKSGSGKSTLIDLIMGLISPTSGKISIDGVPLTYSNVCSWQSHISHVPQEVFLVNGSIEENVVLGIPEKDVDRKKLKNCLIQAQLGGLLDALPDREKSMVGEMGALISGGQRQRIAIARALYADADVLVFDEATSALDRNTEREMMDTLSNIGDGITIIMISHRPEMLNLCDHVINMDEM